MHRIAKHYGIYDDLFNGASFVPVVDLRVTYAFGDDEVTPVHCGNRIDPADVSCFSLDNNYNNVNRFYIDWPGSYIAMAHAYRETGLALDIISQNYNIIVFEWYIFVFSTMSGQAG